MRSRQKLILQSKNKRVLGNFPTEIVPNTLTIPKAALKNSRTADIYLNPAFSSSSFVLNPS